MNSHHLVVGSTTFGPVSGYANHSLFKMPDISSKIEEMIRKHQIVCDDLTEHQIASAIKQAMECGDFLRLVTAGDDKQSVVYIPYKMEEARKLEISRLREEISELKKQLPMNCKTCNTPEPIYQLKDGQCFNCTYEELVKLKDSAAKAMEAQQYGAQDPEQMASAILFPNLVQPQPAPSNTSPDAPSPCKA